MGCWRKKGERFELSGGCKLGDIFEKKKQRGGTERWEAEGNREESRDGAFERRLAERERAKRGEENRERRRQESREVGGCRGGGFSWLFDGDFGRVFG